jgi:hypothetical protein
MRKFLLQLCYKDLCQNTSTTLKKATAPYTISELGNHVEY